MEHAAGAVFDFGPVNLAALVVVGVGLGPLLCLLHGVDRVPICVLQRNVCPPTDKDTILNDEKRRLDNLKGIGALIGTPSVAFLESANSVNQMMNGDFVWDFTVTNTPPLKSATARVCYTDEGFNAFFESE